MLSFRFKTASWIRLSIGLIATSWAGAESPRVRRLEVAPGIQPQLSVTAEGHVWLVYANAGDIHVASSPDGGTTFAPPVKVATVPKLMAGMRRGPRIAAVGNHVTVTAVAQELIAFHSSDAGKTWSEPVTINDAPTSAREGLHDLALAPDGALFVTWLDLRNGTMELWGSTSHDAGRTWEKNETVYRSPDKSICTCCQPSALFDAAGNLAVMWRNSLEGSRDLWLSTRAADRREFSPAKKLGEGTWKLDGCPMDGGRIIASNAGEFSAVWQRAGEVFFCPAVGPEIKLGAGKQPVAVPTGAQPLVVWQQGADLVSATVGVSSEPTIIAAEARYPVLLPLPNGHGAVLAYEQGPTATPHVVVERW